MKVFAINPDNLFFRLEDIFNDRIIKESIWFHNKNNSATVSLTIKCAKKHITFYNKGNFLYTYHFNPKEEIFVRIDDVKNGKRIIIYIIEDFEVSLLTLFYSNEEIDKFEYCLKNLEMFSLS